MKVNIRLAEPGDIPILEKLITDSVMVLQAPDYSEEQRRGALGTVFGIDTQLIRDKTYFAAISDDGIIVGCGGWSFRQTLYGSDGVSGKNDQELDPARDAARIRAFFIKPGWERRGIGGQILHACEKEAAAKGFTHFELGSTVTGIGFYSRHGYLACEPSDAALPGGISLSIIRMTKETKAA